MTALGPRTKLTKRAVDDLENNLVEVLEAADDDLLDKMAFLEDEDALRP